MTLSRWGEFGIDVPDDELERELATAEAVVDAVLGYRASGPPHDGVLWLVERLARASVPVMRSEGSLSRR